MSLPVMRPPVALPRVYLHRDPVDFRKSFKGLAVLIEQELGHNPFSGELYVFTNLQRNKIKAYSGKILVLSTITKVSLKINSTG